MRRRSLLQWLASLGVAVRCSGWYAWAQTADFPDAHGDTLAALGAVVLPSELGPDGTRDVVRRFQIWVREYRAGAEMDHGYGFTRLRTKGPSPAPAYLRQLDALRPAISNGDADARRQAVEAALEEAKITDLPRTPDGRHIAADLMSFYFRSSDGNDLCYRAAIGRDLCRGLKGSENAPAPLPPSGAAR
jgi:hypothetical protein